MKKNSLSGLIVLFMLLLTLFACRKSIEFYVEGKEAPKSTQIESAKIWRLQNMDRSSSRSKGVLRPHWKDAWIVRTGDGKELIVVPTPEKRIHNKAFNLRRFYVFTASGGIVSNGTIVEFLGNNFKVGEHIDLLIQNMGKSKISNFDGLIAQYDINYSPISNTVYRKGQKTNLQSRIQTLKPSTSMRMSTMSTNGCTPIMPVSVGWPSSMCADAEVTINAEWVSDEDGCLISLVYNYVSHTCPGGSGSGSGNEEEEEGSGSGGEDGGNPPYGGGGGGGGSQPDTRDINNKTTDPCISATVKAALVANKDLESEISKIIKHFDTTKSVKIDIYDAILFYKDSQGNLTTNAKPGEVSIPHLDGNVFEANITLGKNYHQGTSKEALIATLIHETVHAYIAFTGDTTIRNNHNDMANKFIAPMAEYLHEYFGVSWKDAYALAWGGLFDALAWTQKPNNFEFDLPDNTKVQKWELESISADYKEQRGQINTKGTSLCPQ